VDAGETEKAAPLRLVPMEEPPVEAVYQLILLPVEVALRLAAVPAQRLAGLAVTEVGLAGKAETFTVVVTELEQPLALVYEYVMTELPADLPVTRPEEASMVATPVEALLQVPPDVVLLRVVVNPLQIVVVPVMAANTGRAFTVSNSWA
jgi:hypothetical protein